MPVHAEDLEYAHPGGVSLLARFYRPDGPGPFPAVLEVHGGADADDATAHDDDPGGSARPLAHQRSPRILVRPNELKTSAARTSRTRRAARRCRASARRLAGR